MNNGKICISICAETAEDLIAQIKRAEDLADVIEIRFDCLTKKEFDKLDYRFPYGENYIYTFRPKEQGGNRELSLEEREEFWNSGTDFGGGDFEEDVVENHLYWLYSPVICSYHDFKRIPENLFEIYERIKFNGANVDIIKIAAQTKDISDAIPIWRLLVKATNENQKIIPIAMGEAGKWTRILGLAHGAFMTYAALDSGKETAPGQISARDLIEVYRVKELNEQTEIFGILGSNTSYSMSPFMHNAAFKFHNLNAVFVPLQTHDLDEFMRRMVKPETREIELNFKGFSVTIPHKQSIIKHLDFIDQTAKTIGAVNTVKIIDGKLHGYNTDAHGFITPLKNTFGDLRNAKVAVFGAGGAARACVYALKREGAEITIFARDLAKARSLAEEFQITNYQLPITNYQDFDIIVNATPLGTKGELENESIARAEQIENVNLVYDLVYNPFQTKLLTEADKANVPKIGGMAMLIAQAMEQQKIWTNLDAPMREMSREILKRLQ
ncbi:MAG TPA: shikimate dehydrogenase [Pyrinomonadaceae bacterium]|nr:shikimate dehydrogenase [Pyrinomonadaceae bacterium]